MIMIYIYSILHWETCNYILLNTYKMQCMLKPCRLNIKLYMEGLYL